MGPKALLPLRRKACAEDFFALKILRLRPGVNPRTWVPNASTLPLDHRSRSVTRFTNCSALKMEVGRLVQRSSDHLSPHITTVWNLEISCIQILCDPHYSFADAAIFAFLLVYYLTNAGVLNLCCAIGPFECDETNGPLFRKVHLNIYKYSETCLNRTPYIPETWTNGK